MKNWLRSNLHRFMQRHQGPSTLLQLIKAGVGGAIAIGVIAWLSIRFDSPLLMAPFGATCVLLFTVPSSPLSQPMNVVGGHFVSTLIGLLLHQWLTPEWWVLGLAVGGAITAMAALRITHPPAGADPLVVFFQNTGFDYLALPVLLGSLALVVIAWIYHSLPPRLVTYPAPVQE